MPRFNGRLPRRKPYYRTKYGCAYLGDAYDLCKEIPSKSVNLIMTSPPFALTRKKQYGNESADWYVEWFSDFAREFKRILTQKGSLIVHVGGSWSQGEPTRTLYNFKLLDSLSKRFYVAQEFYWYNPAKLPGPVEWVNIRRIRVKDAVDPVWWFSKDKYPKASNKRVLRPYSDSMKELLRGNGNYYKPGKRPSGHDISSHFNEERKGSIPPNLLEFSNTDSNSQYFKRCRKAEVHPHPARYPEGIPEFFMKFLTARGDLVLDPFGGSNTTGAVAERLGRKWICFELVPEYLRASKFRFGVSVQN